MTQITSAATPASDSSTSAAASASGTRAPMTAIVTLVDGHPHTLAFLAGAAGAPIACLGVQSFGQSGDIAELYEHHQIDAESVVGAALDLLDR